MKALTAIVIIFVAAAFLAIVPILGNHDTTLPDLNKTPLRSYGESFNSVGKEFGISDSPDKDMTYAPHYVTFHLNPEREGVSIVVLSPYSLPSTSGKTNKDSDVIVDLLSTVKYNIIVDQNKCSYYIYPTESYYKLEC